MKKLSLYKRIFSLMLCVVLFTACAAPAFAQEEKAGYIDPEALQKLVDDFVEERGIDPKDFSIGYVYTATGEEWYYNGDTWYYPASVYKVPLMMMLAEKVSAGELQQDSDLGGYSVALAEEYIISYSNNDYAHYVRKYLGGDEVWRQHAKSYANLDESYYHSDYMDYCYFSPRYITQVVHTLYKEPERFPNIIESMLVAEPTHYFRLSDYMNSTFDVAQKYGAYSDNYFDNFNHTVGIIYTPNPIVLTVMTLNVQSYEKVISDAALMMVEYTLSIDEGLEQYEQEQAEAARIAEEEARKAAEEQAAADAAAKAEAECAAAEEKAEGIAMAEAESRAAARRRNLIITGVAAVLLVLLVTVLVILLRRRSRRRRYEEYERRFRAEMEQHYRSRR